MDKKMEAVAQLRHLAETFFKAIKSDSREVKFYDGSGVILLFIPFDYFDRLKDMPGDSIDFDDKDIQSLRPLSSYGYSHNIEAGKLSTCFYVDSVNARSSVELNETGYIEGIDNILIESFAEFNSKSKIYFDKIFREIRNFIKDKTTFLRKYNFSDKYLVFVYLLGTKGLIVSDQEEMGRNYEIQKDELSGECQINIDSDLMDLDEHINSAFENIIQLSKI